jgi:Arc/MetJ-type ribon-helix-helix transcriptional regulator
MKYTLVVITLHERYFGMNRDSPGNKKMSERIETIVGEAKEVAVEAIRMSGNEVESLGGNLREAIKKSLSARENVVMIRLNKSSLSKIDELVEAGLVNSRSEAAALLISDGIKARNKLFERISEKINEIRKAKSDLKNLLNDNE